MLTKNIFLRFSAAVVLFLSFFTVPASADDYTEWEHSLSIYMNTSSSGAAVSENVVNFPVLVRLSRDNFSWFAQTLPGGDDIRFAKNDGTHLPYHIERWIDGTDNEDIAEIWVLVDTVYGNSTVQSIFMYWGNEDASDSSNSEAVFATSNSFAAAYLLDNTNENAIDYTANKKNAGPAGDIPDRREGMIGYCQNFDGSGDYFGAGTGETFNMSAEDNVTISAWVQPAGDPPPGNVEGIAGIWAWTESAMQYAIAEDADLGFFFSISSNGSDNYKIISVGSPPANGTWYHVAGTMDGSTMTLYVNGAPVVTSTEQTAIFYDQNKGSFRIGLQDSDGDQYQQFYNGDIDHVVLSKTGRSAAWIRLCYENQKSAQTLVTIPGSYTWDTDNEAGIQAGNGTWGGDNYWTRNNGENRVSWPGIGNGAIFAGREGNYIVDISGTQLVGGLTFNTSGYTLSGDTLDFGSDSLITFGSGITAEIDASIIGSIGFCFRGTGAQGRLTLSGNNPYSGTTTIGPSLLLNVENLNDGGANSSIGTSSGASSNLLIDGGTLRHIGDAASTDRLFTVTENGAHIFASGSGSLRYTENGPVAFSGFGSRSIEFGGLYGDGSNIFSPEIGDGSGGATRIVKTGMNSTWILTADHNYTGSTFISAGTLVVNGSLAEESSVTVSSSGTLSGEGMCKGPVTVNGGTLVPGFSVPGKLTTGSLDLSSSSSLEFQIGTQSDTITVAGDLTLDGTINISSATGFGSGTYTLFTVSGVLTDNGLEIGSTPNGPFYEISIGSDAVLLTVSSSLIRQQPSDTTVAAGEDVSFSVTASGEGPLSYEWHIKPSKVVGTSSTLELDSVTDDDAGEYRCIVTDDNGSDTSVWAKLTVLSPPRITEQPPEVYSTLVGGRSQLSLTAEGSDPIIYRWYRLDDDDLLLDSGSTASYTIEETAFSDSGYYYCIVSNQVGSVISDTVHLVVKHLAPAADFTFSPASGTTPLDVSFENTSTGTITSQEWDFGDGNTSTEESPRHTYTESGLFTIKLTVTGPGGTSTLVKVDSLFTFDVGGNPVRLNARYLSGTDVEITINNIDKVDTSSPSPVCDSVGIWIKPQTLPEDTGDGILFVTYPGSSLRGSKIIDTLTLPDSDSLFGLMSGLFWDHGEITPFLPPNGTIVLLRHQTVVDISLQLTSEAVSSSAVRLAWNEQDTSVVSSFRIWFGTSEFDTTLVEQDTAQFSYILREPDETSYLISGLLPETAYFFGIQARSGEVWSHLTDSSITSCITLDSAGSTDDYNSIIVDSIIIDPSSSTLRVSWCIDSSQMKEDVTVGVTYRTDQYPLLPDNSLEVPVRTVCTDTSLHLNTPFLFDTLYYVSLWLRIGNGSWLEPTEDSRDTVRTGPPFRQVITFFDTTKTDDTVPVFNGSVLLWKDDTYTDNTITTDTIDIYLPGEPPEGMIITGVPFFFTNADPVLAFYIGFHINSFPEGFSIGDIRIYRDSSGFISVDHETFIDSAHEIVYVKTDDLRNPFLAMIDTMAPEITVLSDTVSPVVSTEPLNDTLHLSDNTSNLKWDYYYASGNKVPSLRQNGILSATNSPVTFSISDTSHVISSESGLRALLLVSDGVHHDTVNFSRRVVRNSSDDMTTLSNKWNPLYATAELLHPDIDSLIVRIAGSDTSGYDQRYMRLYRWVDWKENHSSIEKWVEYTPSDTDVRSLFTLTPGKLMWLKTRGDRPLHFGSATTLSLKESFCVTLPPLQWTDFGMPYRFGVPIAEIISASGEDNPALHFYRWKKNKKTGIHTLDPVFVPGLPDKEEQNTVIEYISGGGYSIYNSNNDEVELCIPPVPAAMSKKVTLSKRKEKTGWSVKFISVLDNGVELPPLYCGYSPATGKTFYPLLPSFLEIRSCLFDRSSDTKSGHCISSEARDGVAKEILIVNRSDTGRSLDFRLESTGSIPDNFMTSLFNPRTASFENNGILQLRPGSSLSRWLVTGDNDFRQRFLDNVLPLKFALHQCYPNPSRSIVNIRYTVPFGVQERICITIYNPLGKLVWEKGIDGYLQQGIHHIVWNGMDRKNGMVGSGVYIIRLQATDPHSGKAKLFERRVTLFR